MTVVDVIGLQRIDGRWETLGADTQRGVTIAGGVQCSVDGAGPRDLSFSLQRDGQVPWPDLGAFTPVEYLPDGLLVWSGRIRDTPTDEQLAGSVVTVNCVGGQYHLDDDKVNRAYVHTRLSDYRDQRSFLTAYLPFFTVAGTVATESAITIGWPNAAVLGANSYVGATLDLGIENSAKRIVVEWEHSNNAPGISFYAHGGDYENATYSGAEGVSTAFNFALTGGATGTTAGTFATERRFVHLFLYYAAGGTLAADVWFKIKAARVFTDTAYESGNASILQAHDVVLDVLDRALPQLSTRTERITQDAGSYAIPEFLTRQQSSPREVFEAVNAFMDYRLGVDEQRRLVFEPRPTAASVESVGEFDDASANSGDAIFNRVIVEGTGPDGSPSQAQRAPAGVLTPLLTNLSNPSFASDTSGWAMTFGSITRDTGVFDSTPASGLFTTQGSGVVYGGINIPDSILAGTTLRFRIRRHASMISGNVQIGNGALNGGNYYTIYPYSFFSTGAFGTLDIQIGPGTGRFFYLAATGAPVSTAALYVDSFEFMTSDPTIAGKRGFLRTAHLPVQSAMPTAALEVIGDLWLRNHVTTPLKGTARVMRGQAFPILGGAEVSPAEMLLKWGDIIRLPRSRDPDTGA